MDRFIPYIETLRILAAFAGIALLMYIGVPNA